MPEAAAGKRVRLAAVAALAVLTLFVFGQVGGHPFIGLDDTRDIVGNRGVRAGLTAEGIRWAFSIGHPPYWHPLTTLSHIVDAQLFGMDAGAHLLENAALHFANAALFFLLVGTTTGRWWSGALAAALFAVHPLRVESVAWAAERKDVLSGLFWMLTGLAAVRHARRPSAARFALVAALFACGLLAKPVLVTLPVVLLLLELWPLGRVRAEASARPWLEKLALICLAAPVALITWLVVRQTTFAERVLPLPERLANAAVSTVTYLGQVIWPSKLAIFYPQGGGTPLGQSIGSAALLALVTWAAWRLWSSRPWLLAGWIWFVVTLLPTLGIVPNWEQARADRFTYLPLAGVFWAVAEEARVSVARFRRARRFVLAAVVAAIAALAVAARAQTALWRNPETLFTRAIAVTQDNWLAHAQLGVVLLRKGRDLEAERHLRRALELRSLQPQAHNNLGVILERTGRRGEAAREYEVSIRQDPGYVDARVNLGTLRFREGRNADAIDQYFGALAAQPGFGPAHFNLGLVLEAQGRAGEAIGHYAAAARSGTRPAQAHARLGVLLAREGRRDEALAHLETALRLNPSDKDAAGALQRLQRELKPLAP